MLIIENMKYLPKNKTRNINQKSRLEKRLVFAHAVFLRIVASNVQLLRLEKNKKCNIKHQIKV